MGRLMGLDVGSRTVGVAVSDMLGWTAQGVEIVQINEDEQEFGLDRIAELVKENEVVGYALAASTLGPEVLFIFLGNPNTKPTTSFSDRKSVV